MKMFLINVLVIARIKTFITSNQTDFFMKKIILSYLTFAFLVSTVFAQQVGSSPAYIEALTSQWKGERYPDGRPKISDNLLERLKKISMEQAWGYLRSQKYNNQFEANWELIMYPDQVMVGRAVTAQYMPARPDLVEQVKQQGLNEKRSTQGGTNTWPIDVLVPGDVYVADSYGKIIDGTLIGDMLGNTIYANSKKWCDILGCRTRYRWTKSNKRIQCMGKGTRSFLHHGNDSNDY